MSNDKGFGIFEDENHAEEFAEARSKSTEPSRRFKTDDPEENDALFLTFQLGHEVYASELLSVREIIEFQKPKPLPNTLDFFRGVINLRGEIVGIIDLRMKFGLQGVDVDDEKQHIPLLIFDSQSGALGAMVDRVGKVCRIDRGKIDHNPNVKSRVPQKYLKGIGLMDDEMITIIDLRQVLDDGELLEIKTIQKAG